MVKWYENKISIKEYNKLTDKQKKEVLKINYYINDNNILFIYFDNDLFCTLSDVKKRSKKYINWLIDEVLTENNYL